MVKDLEETFSSCTHLLYMMALPTTHDSHNVKDVLDICAQEDVLVV